MEPVSIPSDEEWLRDFYSKGHHNGKLVALSRDEFARALEQFQATKYRFVIGLEELEILNRQDWNTEEMLVKWLDKISKFC